MDWVTKYTELKTEDVYIIKGEFINSVYELTGDNAYPKERTFQCIKLGDMKNPEAVFFPRFEIGARWFDDIIANDIAMENGYRPTH